MLARLHGVWGLEQLVARAEFRAAIEQIAPLLDDADPEVRAQAAKAVGDSQNAASLEKLISLLGDENLRVRFFAAQSLGKLGDPQAIEPLLVMLAENADKDPVLRHAGVMGLVGSAGSAESLTKHALHGSPAERLAILLALRRMQADEVAMFLADSEPRIVLEAARAIHDLPLPESMPKLAALITRSTADDALLRRVLDANYRLGTPEAAARPRAVRRPQRCAGGDAAGSARDARYVGRTIAEGSRHQRLASAGAPRERSRRRGRQS